MLTQLRSADPRAAMAMTCLSAEHDHPSVLGFGFLEFVFDSTSRGRDRQSSPTSGSDSSPPMTVAALLGRIVASARAGASRGVHRVDLRPAYLRMVDRLEIYSRLALTVARPHYDQATAQTRLGWLGAAGLARRRIVTGIAGVLAVEHLRRKRRRGMVDGRGVEQGVAVSSWADQVVDGFAGQEEKSMRNQLVPSTASGVGMHDDAAGRRQLVAAEVGDRLLRTLDIDSDVGIAPVDPEAGYTSSRHEEDALVARILSRQGSPSLAG